MHMNTIQFYDFKTNGENNKNTILNRANVMLNSNGRNY